MQAGGSIDRYVVPIAEQQQPMSFVTPGFASLYKPLLAPAERGNIGRRGGRSGSQAREDRLKAKGFSNDIEYAFNRRDELTNSMAQRAQNADYVGSPEYVNDYKELQKANREISQLEAIQKDFKLSLKGKNIEGGSYAIHNNDALVFDTEDNQHKIVSLQEAMGDKGAEGKKRYQIATISTAQNLRSRDSNFHGFTDEGKFLQEIILNSYNSSDLYDSVDGAFKNAGMTSDVGSMIALSDGSKVDADDFYRYIASGLDVKATIMSEVTSNKRQLDKGVENLLGRVTSNPGTMSAYRNYAIGRMLDEGVDASNMSTAQFEQVVDEYVQQDLMSRMKVFVEEKFSKKFKESTKNKGATGAGADPEKTPMHTNVTIFSQAAPTGYFRGEYESLFKGETASLGITSSPIDNSPTFIGEGFVGEGGIDPYGFLSENRNIKSLIDGNLNNTVSLFNGTPLKELNGGHGIRSAVIPNDQYLEVLHMVPVRKDPNTDQVTIDLDYLQFMDYYKKVLDNAIVNAGVPRTAAGAEQIKQIKKNVKEKLSAGSEEFAQFIREVESGGVVFRNMVAFDVLIPENLDNLGIALADRDKFGRYLQDADDSEYLQRSGEDFREMFSEGWFGTDDVYRVKVFAPIKPVGRQEVSQFKGVEKMAFKEGEYRRILEGVKNETTEYHKYKNLEDIPYFNTQ